MLELFPFSVCRKGRPVNQWRLVSSETGEDGDIMSSKSEIDVLSSRDETFLHCVHDKRSVFITNGKNGVGRLDHTPVSVVRVQPQTSIIDHQSCVAERHLLL